jgi:hypothetical protein
MTAAPRSRALAAAEGLGDGAATADAPAAGPNRLALAVGAASGAELGPAIPAVGAGDVAAGGAATVLVAAVVGAAVAVGTTRPVVNGPAATSGPA